MPQKTLLELAETSASKDVTKAYGETSTPKEHADNAERLVQAEKLLFELMRPMGDRPKNLPKVDMAEAVHAPDFRILFPRVVQSVLQQPQEPAYIGQSLLSKTIQVDGNRIMEFPTLGAIRAFELSETQEPPEQDPSFTENITEIRVRRFGLKLEMTEEVIEESQWDVLGLYTSAAGAAMRRKKEELIFAEYEATAVNLFNNESTDQTLWTSGRKTDGLSKNGTFDHMDLLDMMAALSANGYNPTDVVLHPLAWSIWAKDPVLRFQLLNRGGIGTNLPTAPNAGGDSYRPLLEANQYVPFGLNVVVTPFQTLSYNKTLSAGTTGTAAHHTTITVVDRDSSILVMQRSPMTVTQWDNPIRDIRALAFHEKYGLALLNGGRSAVTAKNIRLDLNYNPLYTVRQVAAS